jgi:hypothetical protein
LSRAAEKGDERVVKLLLENGAQPDFEDEEGQTQLSRAASQIIADLLKLYCDAWHSQIVMRTEAARDERGREKRNATHPSSKSTYGNASYIRAGTDNERIT